MRCVTAETEYDPGLDGDGAKPAPRALGRVSADERRARRRRGRWRSPLTRRVLAMNVLVVVVPIFGLLHLDQYRASLVSAAQDALAIQGQAFSQSLGSTAAISNEDGRERLMPDITRSLMRLLFSDTGVRARIFAPDGQMIADSFMLHGPGGDVQVVELPPLAAGSTVGRLGGLYNRMFDWLLGMSDLPPYADVADPTAKTFEEVREALGGSAARRVRVAGDGTPVLSVAVPVQRYRQILGTLLLTRDGHEITEAVYDRRRDILLVFGIALALTVVLSLYLAGTIARPIRRLAAAADRVRHGKGRDFEIPDFTHRDDEIGDLSEALRAMTEALRARLDAIEGFAADVSHEIKNPLTSLRSAVETVARVEDPEQQKKLMSIILDDIQRMDRLITDISDASRLDAELSREETEPVDVCRLLELIVEVQRATDEADQPRFDIAAPGGGGLLVTGLEDRLGQVFRNLISNAASFSPPGGAVNLAARREDDWILVEVADEGPGIPPDSLENVFNRFYSERPSGEKFGTHSGLGLSISRQIIEAHGGEIWAENRMGGRGQVLGARFLIRLPAA